MKIHLIEKYLRERKVSDAEPLYESGYWTLSKEKAESLIGGDIYLHTAQDKPSRFGGVIQGFRVDKSDEFMNKIVFRFLADPKHKGVRTSKEGWGNEKKIVGD